MILCVYLYVYVQILVTKTAKKDINLPLKFHYQEDSLKPSIL